MSEGGGDRAKGDRDTRKLQVFKRSSRGESPKEVRQVRRRLGECQSRMSQGIAERGEGARRYHHEEQSSSGIVTAGN